MTVLRERMVEPENAITVTPLRPEDDYSPRERRGGSLQFPERPDGAAPAERLPVCLVRNERGLGFSIAGGKGSTPYRPGDTVSSGQGSCACRTSLGWDPGTGSRWRHPIPARRPILGDGLALWKEARASERGVLAGGRHSAAGEGEGWG